MEKQFECSEEVGRVEGAGALRTVNRNCAKDDLRAIKEHVFSCSVCSMCICSPVFIVVDGSFSVFSRRKSPAFIASCLKNKEGGEYFFKNILHSPLKRNGYIVFSE